MGSCCSNLSKVHPEVKRQDKKPDNTTSTTEKTKPVVPQIQSTNLNNNNDKDKSPETVRKNAWYGESPYTPFLLTAPPTPEASLKLLCDLSSSKLFTVDEKGKRRLEVGNDGPPPTKDTGKLVEGIVACLDAVLQPLLPSLETIRNSEELNEGTKASINVVSAIKELEKEVEQKGGIYYIASQKDYTKNIGSKPREVLETSVICGLNLLRWLYCSYTLTKDPNHAESNSSRPNAVAPIVHSKYYIESMNNMLTILLPYVSQPSHGMERINDVVERFIDIRRLLGMLGILAKVQVDERDLFEGLPYFALNSATKSYLLYLETIILGQSKLYFTVDRTKIIESTSKKMKEMSVYNKIISGDRGTASFYKFFPVFQLDGGNGVEAGEGHGPRKEFFDLAAQEMMQEWGSVTPVGSGVASLVQGSSVVTLSLVLSPNQSNPVYMIPGTKLTFQLPEGRTLTAVLVMLGGAAKVPSSLRLWPSQEVVDRGVVQHICLRLDALSPTTVEGVSFSYQLVNVPIFRLDLTRASSYCWFNPQLSTKPSGSNTNNVGDKFAMAGWLAAQAVANGVAMPLPLPVAFFSFLLTQMRPFAATEADVMEFDSNMAQRIQKMSDSEFKKMLYLQEEEVEQTKEQFIKQKIAETYLSESVIEHMAAFRQAFFGTGLAKSVVFQTLHPDELQAIVVGRPDDGLVDFELLNEFRIVTDGEFNRFPYNELLLKCIVQVVDFRMKEIKVGEVTLKRLFLKFITGRQLLPARKGEEVIRLEFPYSTMSVYDYDSVADRLPQSHTCDNTLEMPNYCEVMLFSSQSWWYKHKMNQDHTLDTRKCMVNDQDRINVLKEFTESQLDKFTSELEDKIFTKLSLAITSTQSYDLDEVALQYNPGPPTGAAEMGEELTVDELPLLRDKWVLQR